ncbi:NUDIX domain-containing protein [Pseudomonas sp. ICMP 460]|uniref:NUDIX domain-containing protein n=1 Tax=Pseudomonas sp. ICMP 460 TaxID=1718917 RepID=UPI000C075394|nr:NUDIX domain-containing protein [Pseudomonas sp. ICMP 460]PHN21867.1 DNA mismatch repair protein MutT [Pseudomonas sp. ICMP 460]
MSIVKACPVVLRTRQSLEILAFEHPLAGFQLVMGGVESGETTASAAIRELHEEARITGKAIRELGTWHAEITGHTWVFHQCQVSAGLPDTWIHFTEDDGGHQFRFFWHPLGSELTNEWHSIFRGALITLMVWLRHEAH